MSDALKRAIRTAVQSGVGLFALLAIPWLNDVVEWASGDVANFPAWSMLGRAGVAFVAGVFISLLAWLQNLGEDKGKVPALLKEPNAATRNLRRQVGGQAGSMGTTQAMGLVIIALLIVIIILLT